MLERYVVYAPTFTGNLLFGFNTHGDLVEFTNNTEGMVDGMLNYLRTAGIPSTKQALAKLVNSSKTLECRLVQADLSFEHFWETYGLKVDRKEAEREWEKLSDVDKLKVLESLPAYNYYLMVKRIQKVYAVRYLGKRRFEVDYKALAKA